MTKQIFKGTTLTRTKTVNNILRVYEQRTGDEDTRWYAEANSYARSIASLYKGVTTEQACGVLAALSPQMWWDRNKQLASDYLSTGKAKHYGTLVSKCDAIMGAETIEEICDILNGSKITSFFLNIVDPVNSTAVTIDRHALEIALNKTYTDDERPTGMTAKQYDFFAECYTIAGVKAGIPAHHMQSVTWEIWRRQKHQHLNEETDYSDVPF